MSSTGALDVAVEVAMIFQLRPTTTGASLRWHRDVSWVCGSCTATPGASRRRKTQVPARVLCLSGSCRLSHAEKHGSQRAKGAAVPARAGQMKVSHVWEFSRARSASRRTRTGPRKRRRENAHRRGSDPGQNLTHFCDRYIDVPWSLRVRRQGFDLSWYESAWGSKSIHGRGPNEPRSIDYSAPSFCSGTPGTSGAGAGLS